MLWSTIDLHDEVACAVPSKDEVAAERAMRAIIDEAAGAVAEEGSDQSDASQRGA